VNLSFVKTISPEEINALPILQYKGSVHLIDTDSDLEIAIGVLEKECTLGFDTETRPSFKKGKINPTSILQLAGEQHVYLFQLSKLSKTEDLFHLLSSQSIQKAGVAIAEDIKRLQEITPYTAQSFWEISTLAQKMGIKHMGLRSLAAILLHGRVAKTLQTSNWANNTLTQKQISYAATDAWVSRELFLKLVALGALDI
jgi:ribonuclease D